MAYYATEIKHEDETSSGGRKTVVGGKTTSSGTGGSSGSTKKNTLAGEGYTYDKNVDYAALMNQAAAKGDYQSAAQYEQQRNAKIIGEGMDTRGITNNYGKWTESGKNADYGYGYGWGTGNRVTEVTDKQGNKIYTSATRLDDPALKNSGIDFNNIGSTYSFATPGGIDENYNKSLIAGDIWYGGWDDLSGAEQRMYQAGKNWGNHILGTTGMSPYTGDYIMGANSAYGMNTLLNTNGNGQTMALLPYGNTGANINLMGYNNPYYDQIDQATQENRDHLDYLMGSYDDRKDNIISALDAYIKRGTDQLNSRKTDVEEQAEQAGRQAYVAYMMQQKNLPALLAAQGIKGGGTESAYLDLMTAYQGQKGNINQDRLSAIRGIDDAILDLTNQAEMEKMNQLNANSSAALQAYQNAWSDNRNYLGNLYNSAVGYDQWNTELAMQQQQAALENQRYQEELAYNKEQQALANTMSMAEMGLISPDEMVNRLSAFGLSKDAVQAYYDNIQAQRAAETRKAQGYGSGSGGSSYGDVTSLYQAMKASGSPETYLAMNYGNYGIAYDMLDAVLNGYSAWEMNQRPMKTEIDTSANARGVALIARQMQQNGRSADEIANYLADSYEKGLISKEQVALYGNGLAGVVF